MSSKNGAGSIDCVVLPFAPRKPMRKPLPNTSDDAKTTTRLAALVAVTVFHDKDVSAENRLIEIIEQSGDVEVLDSDEAFANFGLSDSFPVDGSVDGDDIAANDNDVLMSL